MPFDGGYSYSDLGVDSLMAVELVNWIKKEIGITVSQLDILGWQP